MCKVCTEAVHCVALCTRVTSGLGMCKICTEAVHCVSSPLQAFRRWSPLEVPFKPPSSPLQAPFKPLRRLLHLWKASSPLQASLKPSSSPFKAFRRWSPLEALLKPPLSPLQAPSKPPLPSKDFKGAWMLQAPFKPPWSLPKVKPPSSSLKPPSSLRSLFHLWKASSPLEALLKSPSSLLEAPSSLLQVLSSEGEAPLEAFERWSPLEAFVKGTFKGCFAEGETPFVTEECPS